MTDSYEIKYADIYLNGNLTKYKDSSNGHVYNKETGKELSPDTTHAGYKRAKELMCDTTLVDIRKMSNMKMYSVKIQFIENN